MNYKEDLIQKFYDYEIIKRQGPKYPDGFLLKSGVRSDLYINIRDLIKHPTLFNFTMHCMHQLICDTYFDEGHDLPSVIGIPTMGAVIAPIMAYKKSWPLAVIRHHKKDHGIGSDVEGTLSNNIVVIDDVITSGSSIVEMADKYIRPRYGEDWSSQVFVIVDRQAHTLACLGGVKSLMTLQEIRDFKPMSLKSVTTGRYSCQ
jgi:orotate phosphoribosyltransferase